MNKLYCFLLSILSLSCFYALRSDINVYISKMWVGELFAYVFKACSISTLFNILLILALCYFSFIVGKIIYHSKGSILISICILFAIVYLYTNNYWTFAQAYIVNVGYDSLLIISLLTLLIADIIAIARQWLSANNEDESFQDDLKGYCMDEVYTKHRETGWDNYVKDLLSLMPRERLKKESLAIGISGKWGSGKTSFLKTMMESMKDDYLEISFNPWKCTDKVQIVSQFFTLMRKELDGNDKPLEKAIQKYRDIILDADIHPILILLAKILPECKEEETLESLKNKIEKAISSEGAKPFAIFIDDLDRLEGDELFEVLRLIRVTANFRNMVFVVAYDREYICNVLNQSKNIERAEEYIQKIFHFEVSLPKFEEETLFDVFMEEFSRIYPLEEKYEVRFRSSILQLCNSAKVSFTDFIPNFRQARRFANIFALNLKAILSHTKDFIARDFFGIELIHFAFPDVHHTLMYKPMTLLKQRLDDKSKGSLFVFEGEDKTPCEKVLRRLFLCEETTQRTSRAICSQTSFANYFCYRLPNNVIGTTEFEMVMIEDDLEEIRKKVHSWILKNNVVGSLYEHFRSYYMHGYKEKKIIRNYICALLEFLPCLTEYGIQQIASDRYWLRNIEDVNELQNQIISLFEYSIGKGSFLEKINCLLTTVRFVYDDDYRSNDMPYGLLDYKQTTMLAGKSLTKYLEQQNDLPSPSEITKNKTAFNTFIMSARYVNGYSMDGDQKYEIYSNLLCCELIKHFNGIKADQISFNGFIKPFLIQTDDPVEEEYEVCHIKNYIRSIFDNYTYFEEFVHKTFTPNVEIESKLKYVYNIMH